MDSEVSHDMDWSDFEPDAHDPAEHLRASTLRTMEDPSTLAEIRVRYCGTISYTLNGFKLATPAKYNKAPKDSYDTWDNPKLINECEKHGIMPRHAGPNRKDTFIKNLRAWKLEQYRKNLIHYDPHEWSPVKRSLSSTTFLLDVRTTTLGDLQRLIEEEMAIPVKKQWLKVFAPDRGPDDGEIQTLHERYGAELLKHPIDLWKIIRARDPEPGVPRVPAKWDEMELNWVPVSRAEQTASGPPLRQLWRERERTIQPCKDKNCKGFKYIAGQEDISKMPFRDLQRLITDKTGIPVNQRWLEMFKPLLEDKWLQVANIRRCDCTRKKRAKRGPQTSPIPRLESEDEPNAGQYSFVNPSANTAIGRGKKRKRKNEPNPWPARRRAEDEEDDPSSDEDWTPPERLKRQSKRLASAAACQPRRNPPRKKQRVAGPTLAGPTLAGPTHRASSVEAMVADLERKAAASTGYGGGVTGPPYRAPSAQGRVQGPGRGSGIWKAGRWHYVPVVKKEECAGHTYCDLE
jgi:hypothetical protein